MDLVWGTGVAATDGWAGSLAGAFVTPNDNRVTHLIVKRGLIFAKRMPVPVGHLQRWDGESLYLDLSILDVLRLPRAEPSAVALTARARVRLSDGARLRLAGVQTTDGSVSRLVLGRAVPLFDDVLFPVESVANLDSSEIVAEAGSGDLKALTAYRQSRDIEDDYWETLYASEEVSDVDLRGMAARVDGSRMVLEGNVRTRVAAQEAERFARSVPGVAEVKNRIVSDWDIDLAAGAYISKENPRLAGFVAFHTQLGTVQAEGLAPSAHERDSLMEGIGALPGVRGVESSIGIAPEAFVRPEPPAEAADHPGDPEDPPAAADEGATGDDGSAQGEDSS